jgi:hypothetical protein
LKPHLHQKSESRDYYRASVLRRCGFSKNVQEFPVSFCIPFQKRIEIVYQQDYSCVSAAGEVMQQLRKALYISCRQGAVLTQIGRYWNPKLLHDQINGIPGVLAFIRIHLGTMQTLSGLVDLLELFSYFVQQRRLPDTPVADDRAISNNSPVDYLLNRSAPSKKAAAVSRLSDQVWRQSLRPDGPRQCLPENTVSRFQVARIDKGLHRIAVKDRDRMQAEV